MRNNLLFINRELYAYITILRQLSAKYENSELNAQVDELNKLYEEVSSPDFDENDNLNINSKLDELRILVLNLHILIINNKLDDLNPVCIYLGDLIEQVKAAISKQ